MLSVMQAKCKSEFDVGGCISVVRGYCWEIYVFLLSCPVIPNINYNAFSIFHVALIENQTSGVGYTFSFFHRNRVEVL
jgi:hypothetical protein